MAYNISYKIRYVTYLNDLENDNLETIEYRNELIRKIRECEPSLYNEAESIAKVLNNPNVSIGAMLKFYNVLGLKGVKRLFMAFHTKCNSMQYYIKANDYDSYGDINRDVKSLISKCYNTANEAEKQLDKIKDTNLKALFSKEIEFRRKIGSDIEARYTEYLSNCEKIRNKKLEAEKLRLQKAEKKKADSRYSSHGTSLDAEARRMAKLENDESMKELIAKNEAELRAKADADRQRVLAKRSLAERRALEEERRAAEEAERAAEEAERAEAERKKAAKEAKKAEAERLKAERDKKIIELKNKIKALGVNDDNRCDEIANALNDEQFIDRIREWNRCIDLGYEYQDFIIKNISILGIKDKPECLDLWIKAGLEHIEEPGSNLLEYLAMHPDYRIINSKRVRGIKSHVSDLKRYKKETIERAFERIEKLKKQGFNENESIKLALSGYSSDDIYRYGRSIKHAEETFDKFKRLSRQLEDLNIHIDYGIDVDKVVADIEDAKTNINGRNERELIAIYKTLWKLNLGLYEVIAEHNRSIEIKEKIAKFNSTINIGNIDISSVPARYSGDKTMGYIVYKLWVDNGCAITNNMFGVLSIVKASLSKYNISDEALLDSMIDAIYSYGLENEVLYKPVNDDSLIIEPMLANESFKMWHDSIAKKLRKERLTYREFIEAL